jgi:hypothetical protein
VGLTGQSRASGWGHRQFLGSGWSNAARGTVPNWSGVRVEPLGAVPLQLMARRRRPAVVRLFNRLSCPLLHPVFELARNTLVSQPRTAQERPVWLKRL